MEEDMNINEAYLLLEINPNASKEEIKKAYHLKMKIYHPDTSTGNTEKAQDINIAYKLCIERLNNMGNINQQSNKDAKSNLSAYNEIMNSNNRIIKDWVNDAISKAAMFVMRTSNDYQNIVSCVNLFVKNSGLKYQLKPDILDSLAKDIVYIIDYNINTENQKKNSCNFVIVSSPFFGQKISQILS
jgi:hypothetical protein